MMEATYKHVWATLHKNNNNNKQNNKTAYILKLEKHVYN